jgi:hypothetical protein
VTDPAGRPPDLLFCRGCGGSIARREFLAGRALLVEGRAWCPACAPGMLAKRRAFRGVLGVAAFAAALAAGLALYGAVGASLDSRERSRRAEEAARGARLRVEEALRRLDSLEAESKGIARLAQETARGLEAGRKDPRGAQDPVEDRIEGLERSLGTLMEAVEGIRKDLVPLRGPARLSGEEEAALLARMDDANAGTRFEALWALQRGTGEAARKAAVRGLSDPEDSVRWMAAVLARDLRVAEAAPALVECLSHPGPAVRTAALEALRALEGTDLGLDPLEPSEARRAEAVLRWKERMKGR